MSKPLLKPMGKTFLVAIIILTVTSSAFSQKKNVSSVNWSDSLSVESYIQKLSICERINFVVDSTRLFAEEHGFSLNLLNNISKETNENFYIPIASMGIVHSDKMKEFVLREQMIEIRKKYCK